MIRAAKILSALAVSSGIFSIIGTGFGAWIFSNHGNYNVDVFLSGLQIEIGTDAELGHFRNQEADYYYEPHILVFDEGTNPTDLNDGLSFFKEQEHPVLGEGVTAPVRDDELEIIFHKDANFNEVEYGLKFQIGASIELISDEAATAELNNFIQISDYLYTDGSFVDLTNNFEIGEKFEHEGTEHPIQSRLLSGRRTGASRPPTDRSRPAGHLPQLCPLLSLLGWSGSQAGQRPVGERQQPGECRLSLGTLCRTHYPVLCQLAISRCGDRDTGHCRT